MGYLKNIGKKECCDSCTTGKCDDCQVRVFAFRSICGVTNEPIITGGYFAYLSAEAPFDCSSFDCVRWLGKLIVNDEIRNCNQDGETSSRRVIQGQVLLPETITVDVNPENEIVDSGVPQTFNVAAVSEPQPPLSLYDWWTLNSSSGSPCFENEFESAPGPLARSVITTIRGHFPELYTCTSHEIEGVPCVEPYCSNPDGSVGDGLLREVLFEQNTFGRVIRHGVGGVVPCFREDCVAGSVFQREDLLEVEEPDPQDVYLVTHDDEEDEFCGDGQHWRFLGGDPEEMVNWRNEGLVYFCPHTSAPSGCSDVSGQRSAFLATNLESICNEIPTGSTLRMTYFSVAIKDLIPTHQYKLKLHYRVCDFSEKEAIPNCSQNPPEGGCVNDPEGEEVGFNTVVYETEFVAENWAEVLSLDCDDLEVGVAVCRLEREAAQLNTGDSGSRTVGCQSTDIVSLLEVPMQNNRIHTFIRAELEEIAEE